MRFCVLGPVVVLTETGQPIPVGGAKPRTLLSLLLLDAPGFVSRQRVIDEIWGDFPPASARHAVDVYASLLRGALGRDRIVTQPSGYLLDLDGTESDLADFDLLLQEARRLRASNRPDLAAVKLQEALNLWRAHAFADAAFHGVAAAAAARLDERRLAAHEDLLDVQLDLGHHGDVVAELPPLIAEHPFRERLRAQLMLGLYRAGRQADALRAYRDARRTLRDELGIEPTERLRALERAILRQDESLLSRSTPQTPELPHPATPLIGRGRELTELRELLWQADVRLVTVVGAGGVGKTHLALEAASRLASDHIGGAFFVDLAPVRSAADVLPAIAAAVGAFARTGSAFAHLVGQPPTLLLLDNFEHVAAAAADVGSLLARSPRLKVLITSRVPLGIAAERVYPLGPIDISDAVELFAQRARAADPSFAPGALLTEVCRRLDCLPLAIELAAVRTPLLSTVALLQRLDHRLELLADRAADRPQRQRTLRATLDWSYDLLNEAERNLLAEMSVFVGDWTVEAAEAVCGADLDLLESLRANSLIRRRTIDGGAFRFGMLETIREYAAERLRARGDGADVRERHARYFLELAEMALGEIGIRQGPATFYTKLDGERDNIRAALDWFRESGDHVRELRLSGAAIFVWSRAELEEGRSRIVRALARAPDGPALFRARALAAAAHLALRSGRFDEAERLGEESLALRREIGDRGPVAASLLLLSSLPDETRALAALDEAEGIARELRDDGLLGDVLNNRAMRALEAHRLDEASDLFEFCLTRARRLRATQEAAIAASNLATTRLCQRRGAEASALYAESLGMFRRVEMRRGIAHSLEGLGLAAQARGDGERAARLLGAAERLHEEIGVTVDGITAELHAAAVADLRRMLDDETFIGAWIDGRALPVPQAADYALAEPSPRTPTRARA